MAEPERRTWETGNKVKRVYVDPETGEEVPPEDQVKGYAIGKHNYLIVEDQELEKVQIESSHIIEIETFVPREKIDPRYMETPYYIAPDDRVAQEAFAVIREAMRDSNKVALGRVVIGRRERVVMLEPWKKGLLATLLRYGYEVRDEAAYFEDIPDLPITAEMRDLAEVIVQRKSGHFDPTEFEDRYENALIGLMRHKQAGTPAPAPAVSRPVNVVNLMDALRRSVTAEKAAEPIAPVLDAEPKPAITSRDRKARKNAETPAPDTTAPAPKKPRRAHRMM